MTQYVPRYRQVKIAKELTLTQCIQSLARCLIFRHKSKMSYFLDFPVPVWLFCNLLLCVNEAILR